MKSMGFYVVVIYLGCIVSVDGKYGSLKGNTEIYITVNSEVVEFYGNATLFCNIRNFSTESKYTKWTRGVKNNLLTYDGHPNNSGKFREIKNQSGFGLIIMNVTEQDVDMQYTCGYNFQEESMNFTVNETYFQLLPTNETTEISQSVQNGTLGIEIQFRKILPKPICSGVFNGIPIPLQEKSHPTRNGDFYNVTLYGAKPLVDAHCYSVAVNCIIGTKTMTVYNKEQKDCKDDTGYDSKTIWIVVCVLGSSILMTVVGIALYKYKPLENLRRPDLASKR